MLYSDCCNETLIENTTMCNRCKEHCDSTDDGMDFDLKEVAKQSKRGVKPFTKETQLKSGRLRPKKEASFGQKPTPWNNKGTNIKPKVKRNDIVDDDYSKWLGQQPCVVTGRRAKRGTAPSNMHCHHINGRNGIRNDYRQVPLMGYVHSWGNLAYHNNVQKDFIKKNILMIEDVKEFFNDHADRLMELYKHLGGVIKET